MNLFDNQLIEIAIRSIFSVTILFFLTKLLGKRQISELSLFDYVMGISIGNFASEMSINLEANLFNATVAIVIFGLIGFFISVLTMKSLKLRKFFIGVPTILMEHGKLLYDNMSKTKFDVNDLLEQARENGYFDLSEIEYAVLEANGKVSFLPKGEYKNLTIKDMNLKSSKQGLCANIIIDGNIMTDNLNRINKDEKWLLNQLKIKGKKVENILLATMDIDDKLTIYDRTNDEKDFKVLE